ncbi:MAG: MBL fold metallo-hydrolase [Desulfobacteraceae bacterium]
MSHRLVEIPLDRPGFSGFFGAWVVEGPLHLLVDVGPSRSVERFLVQLDAMGVKRIDYILLTHIHLDHTGGLARVLEAYPQARAICHRKAVPHLVDPSKLWAGSRKVLGDVADAYGPLAPVSLEALIPHDEACVPELGVLETPGHAPHHLGFTYRGRLFAGEAGGNYLSFRGKEYLRPATPPRFLLEESLESVERLLNLEDQIICYAHFGEAASSHGMLARFRDQLLRWHDLLREKATARPEPGVAACAEQLLEKDPELKHFADFPPEVRARERFLMENSVRGFLGYIRETLDR